LELVLDIEQGHFQVAHGHGGRLVAEELHENRQTHTSAEHLRTEGMPKLVRDNASRDADCGGDLVQRDAKCAAERQAAVRAGKKKAVSGERIQAAQQTETMHDLTDEGIRRNEALGLQLAKGHVNGPVILAHRAQAVQRQIEALADAHAGVAEEQQGVADAIVAPQQFLLDQAVLFGCQGPWQTPVLARDVVGTNQVGQNGNPFGPGQFFEDTAETDDVVGVSHLG
jgi:hypothetical protein